MVTAQAKFDRIAQRCPPNDFDIHTIAETHLQKSSPQRLIAVDSDDRAMASNAKFVQRAGVKRTAMIATGKIAGFLHQTAPVQVRNLLVM